MMDRAEMIEKLAKENRQLKDAVALTFAKMLDDQRETYLTEIRFLREQLDITRQDRERHVKRAVAAEEKLEQLPNEVRRSFGIRIGMGGGHERSDWYAEDELYEHVQYLERTAREQGRREGFSSGQLSITGNSDK